MQPTLPLQSLPGYAEPVTGQRVEPVSATVPTYVYAVVFASFCIVMGLLWDIMWHISIGRDGLFSPPHVVIYVGALVSGLFSGYQILSTTLRRQHPARSRSVRFWGVFYGSLGAMYCVWGALAMLTSAPFDDWWHNTYGLDVQILTPPHTVLVLGMMMVQFGAMVGVLALQNTTTTADARSAGRIRVLYALSAAFLLSVLYILLSENMGRWVSHNTSYYVTAAFIFPVFLMAVGRGSTLAYPIATITVLYMLAILLPNWVLPLFPATPKLGPVMNPITHYQPYSFPLLLVVPGLALDWLNRRFAGRISDWGLAALAGVVFVALFGVVQWHFGGFLLESPYARNWFFLGEAWPYDNDPDWKYRYKFNPYFDQTTTELALSFGKAIVIAMVSARVGLWWGNWMKRIVR
ncbi:hypothetical protein [Rudanella paleaurantiibacter]|uniref:hypothetical protein n=1 Tax=Rudanella paleaurantiibacter TaxID=2614655 RepID=UPI001FEA45F6|nr:hypothetical protein [Rudanella paleaurantiibacter]